MKKSTLPVEKTPKKKMTVEINIPEEKPKTSGVVERSIVRDKKGGLVEVGTQAKDIYAADYARAKAANSGKSNFHGAAPRVGGVTVEKSTTGPLKGGTKKQLRLSKKSVRNNDASPQAKRSAKKLY